MRRENTMPKPNGPLPDDVRQALQRGSILDAVKLLTRSGGITLKQAKALIEAEMQRAQAGQGVGGHGPARTPVGTPHGGASAAQLGPFPTTADRALRNGQKIEAIRIVREHTGLGLKEAKDMVEAHERTMVPTAEGLSPRNGLSPGEVPRSSGLGSWLLIVIVIASAAGYYFFRHAG
jgi:ribosomal protein L7/L12